MNTYYVYLKKGRELIITAEGYVEDKRAKRFYFHKDAKLKDKKTFFNIADVTGIDAHESTGEFDEPVVRRAWRALQEARNVSKGDPSLQ